MGLNSKQIHHDNVEQFCVRALHDRCPRHFPWTSSLSPPGLWSSLTAGQRERAYNVKLTLRLSTFQARTFSLPYLERSLVGKLVPAHRLSGTAIGGYH
jgi:hypothetical protein